MEGVSEVEFRISWRRSSDDPTSSNNTRWKKIKQAQEKDEEIQGLKEKALKNEAPNFLVDEQGVLYFWNRLCVPNKKELRDLILQEAHASQFSIHPRGTKMYRILKKNYWWKNMKHKLVRMLHFVTYANEWRQASKSRLGYFSLYPLRIGSGKRLVWISLPVYPRPWMAMMLYGSLSIGWLR